MTSVRDRSAKLHHIYLMISWKDIIGAKLIQNDCNSCKIGCFEFYLRWLAMHVCFFYLADYDCFAFLCKERH